MRHLVLLTMLASAGPALAQAAAPESVCVPRATMDRIAAYLSGQPWRDVAPIMDSLRGVAMSPRTCSPEATPAPVPAETPTK